MVRLLAVDLLLLLPFLDVWLELCGGFLGALPPSPQTRHDTPTAGPRHALSGYY